MKCGICKAETGERLVTHTEELNGTVVVIRHVPAQVCPECGNTWYTGKVAARLEAITAQAQAARTDVAVVTYAENAA
jgi:YgiT-type zinc finger domain-containing protein